MNHDNGFIASAFIEVTHHASPGIERFWLEGINFTQPFWQRSLELRYHSRANIKLLIPLPMPSSAAFSPAFNIPCAEAKANAVGRAADPVFPNVSKVEKSFARFRPTVS